MMDKRTNKIGNCTHIFFDAPSLKGFPTDKSVVITVVYHYITDSLIHVGSSVKLPGEPHKQRIGKALAFRSFEKDVFIANKGDIVENIISKLDVIVEFTGNSLDKKITKRIRSIMTELYFDLKEHRTTPNKEI